jgi:hypothetical protein
MGNVQQYCRLVMPFCDVTVSRRYLFPEKRNFYARNARIFRRIPSGRGGNFATT